MGRFDELAQEIAIRVYMDTGNLTEAAEAAGVTTATLRRHLKEESYFAEQMAEARERHIALYETELRKRIFETVTEPREVGGEIHHIPKPKSDQLLLTALRRHAPEAWGPRPVEIEAHVRVEPVDTFADLPPEERATIMKIIAAAQARAALPAPTDPAESIDLDE